MREELEIELVKTLKNIEYAINSIAGILEDRLSGPIERKKTRKYDTGYSDLWWK